MWYLGSLFSLLFQLLAAGLIGQGLVRWCLCRRMRPLSTLFLSPLIGLAVLVLVSTLVGWVGHGYRQWLCLSLTVVLSLMGWWLSRREAGFGGRMLLLAGYAVLSSFPMLGTLLFWNCYCPFTDAFTYLTHGQWLQSHGFRQVVAGRTLHPALTQVTLYQEHGLRMGASFFLGWLQAFYGVPWSADIYPTVAALGLTCGGLAVGAVVLEVCPGRRIEAWLAALAATVTLNGFAFGSIFGFLPQTYGLAFAAGALALRGLDVAGGLKREPSRNLLWNTLPMALCLSAAIVCYSEQIPFLVSAAGLSYLLPWPGSGAAGGATWRARRAHLAWLAAWLAVLVNFEWYRSIKGILLEMGLVVGGPVFWHWWEFPAHALGLKSGVNDGAAWFFTSPGMWMLLGVAVAGSFLVSRWWGVMKRPRQPISAGRWAALWPGVILLVLYAMAFIYFRYGRHSPWPDQPGNPVHLVGQTFSQFKLSNWSSLAAVTLMLTGLTFVGCAAGRAGHIAVLGLLVFWCALGLSGNYRRFAGRVRPILNATGQSDEPFAVYKSLHRSFSSVPPAALVYLDMPSRATLMHRQLIAYFLEDHLVASDWRDDGYIVSWLRPDAPMPNAADCDWIVSWDPPPLGHGLFNPGGLTIKPSLRQVFSLAEKDGPYARETAGLDWWYWTDKDLRLKYQTTGPHPRRVRVRFVYRPATENRVLTVSITAATNEPPVQIEMDHPGESPFVSPPIEVPDGESANLEVDFSCASPGVRASSTDARIISYSIGDVVFEPVR